MVRTSYDLKSNTIPFILQTAFCDSDYIQDDMLPGFKIYRRKGILNENTNEYDWDNWNVIFDSSTSNSDLLERIKKLEAICNVTYQSE